MTLQQKQGLNFSGAHWILIQKHAFNRERQIQNAFSRYERGEYPQAPAQVSEAGPGSAKPVGPQTRQPTSPSKPAFPKLHLTGAAAGDPPPSASQPSASTGVPSSSASGTPQRRPSSQAPRRIEAWAAAPGKPRAPSSLSSSPSKPRVSAAWLQRARSE
eukprot:CAMPEP_0197906970 /NCGR_PEP_ID=MMETSP1439-20131203/63751_1 /TAXON_ID=66791 /ORGANISM="Gonyaulax spinifera, Strain CCMP409" /LENGTH=158 /DNA_ID=CAMNT_0043528371 /DNA_START=74 /DNA_END=547 /DNA_ORIENTATION=+